MRKLSQRQPKLRRLSNRSEPDVEQFICDMKEQVKKDPAVMEKFKEYGVELDEIDNVSVSFCDLDVSAKTKDEEIFLNIKMLDEDSNVDDPTHYLVHELIHFDPTHYLVHELIHFLQQSTGNHKCQHDQEKEEYLDLETEEEAFKTQVDYKKREESEEEAEDYVENLLDHHDMKGKKREEKKDELLDE